MKVCRDAKRTGCPKGPGPGCIYHPHTPLLFIILKNMSKKNREEQTVSVLKESFKEWKEQFRIIY